MEEELPEDLPEEAVEDLPEELPEEPEEEFQLAAHWGLLDAVDEEDNFYEEEIPEDELSEPEEEVENNSLRKEDMRLDEVPEHLRDAVEGSERIKKMLEGTDDGPPAKRRKIDDEDESFKRESHPDKSRLLRQWRVEGNATQVCSRSLATRGGPQLPERREVLLEGGR